MKKNSKKPFTKVSEAKPLSAARQKAVEPEMKERETSELNDLHDRVVKLEGFIRDCLSKASFDSTAATEILKP